MPLSVPTIALALSSLIWVILGSAIARALIKGRPGAPLALRIISALFALIFWADRIFLRVGENISNLVFIGIATLIGIVIVFWLLSRPKSLVYFGDQNE